jgi:uncharacterized protein (TIGR02271 family)
MAAKHESASTWTLSADDDAYWQKSHSSRPYYKQGTEYSYYKPAYAYGSQSYSKYQGKAFDEVESDLRRDWESDATRASSYRWDSAKLAVRDAYDRSHSRTLEAGQTVAIPVTEEELQVGKREVQGGGVRVHTEVTERPVEAQVNLREEHVKVERRPVNRPATDADFDKAAATIEATEKREVAVAAKHARVTEEVVVGKVAADRTETVRDTVRKTDVEVEQLDKTRVDATVSQQAAARKKDASR